MGLGTRSGDITEINLDDPTRTVVMELEANNFEDKDLNPLQLNAMDNTGYVGEEGEKTPIANYACQWRSARSPSPGWWPRERLERRRRAKVQRRCCRRM